MLGILALLFLLCFALMPLVYDLLLPFMKYTPARGMWNSPFVGMENFQLIFGAPLFLSALGNTLLINLPPLVLATGLSFLSAWLVRVIKGNTGRALWLMGAGLLSFLPAQLFIVPMTQAMAGNGLNPTLVYLFMCLLVFLRLAGPAVLLGGAVSVYTAGGKGIFAGVFFFILYGLAGLFTSGNEAYLLYIAPLAENTMTLSLYIYQASMMQGNLSVGAAANLLRTLPQLVLAAAGFFALLRLLKRPQPVVPQRTQKGLSLVGVILLCAGGVLFVAAIVWAAIDRGVMPAASTVSLAIAGCAYLTLFAVAGGLLSFQARKPVVVLVLLLLGAVSGGVASQYLNTRNLGFLNNPLPAAIYGALALLPLAAGAAYLFYRGGRAAVAHTFPLVGMGVAVLLTDHMNNTIYFADRQMTPLAGQAYAAMVEMNADRQTPAASYALTLLCLSVWLLGFAFLFKRQLTPAQANALNQPYGRPVGSADGRPGPAMGTPYPPQPGQPLPGGQPAYPAYPAAQPPYPAYGQVPPAGYGQQPMGQMPPQAGPAPYAPQQPWPQQPGQQQPWPQQAAPQAKPEPAPETPLVAQEVPSVAADAPPAAPDVPPAAVETPPAAPDATDAPPQAAPAPTETAPPTAAPQAPFAPTVAPAEPSPDFPDI